jgi:Mrp family chromosome partitioning ATPase
MLIAPGIMKTIAANTLKIGNNKSSVVACLGTALAYKGYKAGFIDLDLPAETYKEAYHLTWFGAYP